MSKKILILGNSDAGLYEFRKEVVSALIAEGDEVHISVPDSGYIERFKELGAIMHPTVVDRRGMNPVADLKLYRIYLSLVKGIKPDAVLTYTIKPNVYGGIAASRVRVKTNDCGGNAASNVRVADSTAEAGSSLVSGSFSSAQSTSSSSEHCSRVRVLANVTGLGSSLQGNGLKAKFIKFLYRMGLRNASCVFFQNETNLEFMNHAGSIPATADVVLLPGSGVNLEEHRFQEYPEAQGVEAQITGSLGDGPQVSQMQAETRFLYVGRIMDDKGSSELLTAMEEISKDYPGVKLDIIGSYEEETREKYEPWIARLSSKGVVEFHGFRDDVDSFYGRSHALIHPSYHEGMSNVVLEAAAAGRPVLTSDIPGCREGYENGVGGISFEAKSVESLKSALIKFLSMDASERKSMGLAARRFVEEHFDRKIVIDAYLKAVDPCGRTLVDGVGGAK